MPATVFTNPNDLITFIVDNIQTNGAEEITGQVHQDVDLSIVLSLLWQFNVIPPQVLAGFPAWDSLTTYTGGIETIVKHDDKLWLFVSATDNLGTEPGTNSLVWQEISALTLAHFRNQDQYLDFGGPYQRSAQEISEHINNQLIHTPFQGWHRAVSGTFSAPFGGELDGTRYIVKTPGTGLFAGHDEEIAELVSGAWAFTATQKGDTARDIIATSVYWHRESTAWIQRTIATPSLSQVMTAGPYVAENMIFLPSEYNIFVFTALAMDLASQYVKIGLFADVDLDYFNAVEGVDYVIEILNTSGASRNITYTTGVWANGLVTGVLPDIAMDGEPVLLRGRFMNGLMCITEACYGAQAI